MGRCHAVVNFFVPATSRRGEGRDSLETSAEAVLGNELFCERHEGLLTMWLRVDLSQGRPVYSELLCERLSGSKSICPSLSFSLLLLLPLPLSLSLPGIPVHGAVSLLPMIQLF